jgi:hypothetical protein
MGKPQSYSQIKTDIIKPVIEKLKKEYEDEGYICEIGVLKPRYPPSKAIRSGRGTPSTPTPSGAISLSRKKNINDIGVTASVFLYGGTVSVTKMPGIHGSSMNLDAVTPESIEDKIREAFR